MLIVGSLQVTYLLKYLFGSSPIKIWLFKVETPTTNKNTFLWFDTYCEANNLCVCLQCWGRPDGLLHRHRHHAGHGGAGGRGRHLQLREGAAVAQGQHGPDWGTASLVTQLDQFSEPPQWKHGGVGGWESRGGAQLDRLLSSKVD